MQTKNKSIKKQLVYSLLVFALLSVLTSISILISIDRIYKNTVASEIESTTEIISQSIDRFLRIPNDYLIEIRNQIDNTGFTEEARAENHIINDILQFTGTFDSINLLDNNGTVLYTWPYSENYIGIDMSNQDYFKRTISKDQIYWSDTFLSNKTGNPIVALTIKSKSGVVVAYYNISQLDEFISVQLPDAQDFISVIDARGNIISHTHSSQSVLAGNLNNMQSVKEATGGKFGVSTDYYKNTRGLVSTKAAEKSGFIVIVFKSYYRIFQNSFRIYSVFLSIIALISVLFLFLILLFVRNFLSPLDELQNTFRQVASGSYNLIPDIQFIEFRALSRSLGSMVDKIKERESALRMAIDNRDIVLRELNHRTKNNMQLITGIMSLYNCDCSEPDPKETFNKIKSKIETISLIYDNLYSSADLSSIDLKKYIGDLLCSMIYNQSNPLTRIEFSVEMQNINLSIDYAVPCGLILNELIINTIKYAFTEKSHGKIEIKAEIIESRRLEITYSDNGKGLDENFDSSDSESIGFNLINDIIMSQLNGDIEIKKGTGFYCRFGFNMDIYPKRI